MKIWRFKTKDEFAREGLWSEANGTPVGWNGAKKMNYLMGQRIPDHHATACEAGQAIKHDGWTINAKHYMMETVVEQAARAVVRQNIPIRPEVTSEAIPEFDLQRLSKEIDEMFAERLDESDAKYAEILGNLTTSTEQRIKDYKNQVDLIFRDIKTSLLAEVARGHTTISMPGQVDVNIQHTDHPELVEVVKSLNLHHKAMLVGPAGTGKTYMVASLSERMNVPFYKYSCSRDSSVHDLIGYKQPRSETYLETTFLKAYENGGIFLVDEYDAMSGDMALFFNGIADASKFISIPHRDEKPVAKKHKDFYLVMCGNTWGKGSVDYSGRDFQDMALMDRFRFCRHHIGYHLTLEKELMGPHHNFATKLRAALEKTGSYLSTRNIEDISNLLRAGVTTATILKMVLQDVDSEGAKAINREMASV